MARKNKGPRVKGLMEVLSLERVTDVLMDAYSRCPQYLNAFPQKYTRHNVQDMTIRFNVHYDMRYGRAFTLDQDVYEIATVLESKYMRRSKTRCLRASCYSYEYQEIKERVPVEERQKRLKFVDEIKKLEKGVPFPGKFLHINYFGVAKGKQDEGRGSMLIEKICAYADSVKLPLVLYTNSDKAKEFFEHYDFKELAVVTSEEFEFTNTYLIRDPKLS